MNKWEIEFGLVKTLIDAEYFDIHQNVLLFYKEEGDVVYATKDWSSFRKVEKTPMEDKKKDLSIFNPDSKMIDVLVQKIWKET